MATPTASTNPPASSSPLSNPVANTKRSRSVQFSPIGSPDMSRQRQSRDSSTTGHESHDHESTVDETTAIISRQHGGPKGYGTPGDGTVDGERTRNRPGTGISTADGEAEDEEEELPREEGWWKRTIEKYGSVELDNKGSVARDHLALERTFLAWLRTSLAFASIGIAITQLFRLNSSISPAPPNEPPNGFLRLRQVGKPLGATFLSIAVVVLFVGFHRYFESQHWIIRGKFPASRGSVALVALIAALLIVVSLAVVIVVEPSSFEK